MISHNLIQGTPEWAAHRAQHFNASDAPAMLGCSPYKTRAQLLHELHTGIAAEADSATQRRFADGHRFEALARPLAEEIIGDDLAPVVGTEGRYSASFDGLTFMGDAAFEHKTCNEELRACMPNGGTDDNDCRDLPKHYRVQMEQQLMVSGAERVLFMASRWDGGALSEVRSCWYYQDQDLRAEIVAGWKQFEADLCAYVPAEAAEPAPVGRAPESLPALRIELTGMVTASNLDAFKSHALAVFGSINRTLSTDTDFADAEKTVKWCGDVEERLAAAKQHAMSQTESIDALFRTIDDISAEARKVRLELDKLVKARKEAIRGEIVAAGVKALSDHIARLNKRLAHPYMPQVPADFAGKVKGLRTVQSLRDAVDGEVARCKIVASEIADRIEANLRTMQLLAGSYTGMFPDASTLVLKSAEDFDATVTLRVAERERRMEAERARIRAEEQAKAEREARDKLRAEQEAAQRAAAPAPTQPPAAAPIAPPAVSSQAANVVPLGTRAPATQPTLKLGDINRRIAPLSIDAAGLRSLGFDAAGRERSAVLYHEDDMVPICRALIAHLEDVSEQHDRKAA